MDQVKQLEGQLQRLEVEGQAPSAELLEQQERAAADRAAALAGLHDAMSRRREHEAEAHPDGEDALAVASCRACVADCLLLAARAAACACARSRCNMQQPSAGHAAAAEASGTRVLLLLCLIPCLASPAYC